MDEEREKKNEKNGGSDMKKFCMIVKQNLTIESL